MATAATIPVQDLIINKLEKTHGGWGAILNRIQDAAEIALPKKNFETYLKKANVEQEKTEGSDGVLFNGEYFDWREFDSKRLEIVRALATNPKVLLLDEPAAGMNPSETAELMNNIRKIRDTFGIAILLIEHDMSLVMNVCEGIAVLNFGRIIAKGTPEEIQNNPAVIEAELL